MPTLTVDDGHDLARFVAARLEDLRTKARAELTGDVATMLRVEIASRAALVLTAHDDLRTRGLRARVRAIRTLQDLAAPHAGHPDYDPAWRPSWLAPANIAAMRRAMSGQAWPQGKPQRQQAPETPAPDKPAERHAAPPGWENVTHVLRRGANRWEPGRILTWAGPDAVIRWPDGDVGIHPTRLLVAVPDTPQPATEDDEQLIWDRDEDDPDGPELDDNGSPRADDDEPAWVEVLTPDDTAAHHVSADR